MRAVYPSTAFSNNHHTILEQTEGNVHCKVQVLLTKMRAVYPGIAFSNSHRTILEKTEGSVHFILRKDLPPFVAIPFQPTSCPHTTLTAPSYMGNRQDQDQSTRWPKLCFRAPILSFISNWLKVPVANILGPCYSEKRGFAYSNRCRKGNEKKKQNSMFFRPLHFREKGGGGWILPRESYMQLWEWEKRS